MNIELQINAIREYMASMTYTVQELTNRVNDIAETIEKQNVDLQKQADKMMSDLLLPYQDAEDATT